MARVTLSKNKKRYFDFPSLSMQDEFIPVVDLDRNKFVAEYKYANLEGDTTEITLSEHIDDKQRTITPRIVTIEERKFKLPFIILKGCKKSKDTDGILEVTTSVSDPDVTMISPKTIATKYGNSFELEFETRSMDDFEFHIDFYASDNEEGLIEDGELSKVHCGHIKVVFSYHSVIVIIVGTDAPAGTDHAHNSPDSFIRRVDRFLNTSTVENLNIQKEEHVYVLIPRTINPDNYHKLQSYGKNFSNFEVLPQNIYELTSFINSQSNIRNLTYFGHGTDDGPMYEFGTVWLPEPKSFKKASFSENAQACFATCNSKKYAKKFAKALSVRSIGVEGTTFYGTDEISAGKLKADSEPGTSIAWEYTVTSSGVQSRSYSLSQVRGVPFLRKNNLR